MANTGPFASVHKKKTSLDQSLTALALFSTRMAPSYFSHLSSPDDSDIDAVISETTDLCVLEQIAALNTAHLSDSFLPTDIESRFRKLKSFPGANSRSNLPSQHSSIQEKEKLSASPIQPEKSEEATPEIALTSGAKQETFIGLKTEVREGFASSPLMLRRSPSPTRVVCCFGYSPRKMVQRRKGKNCEEIFLDFGVSSMKEQRKELKRVLKEQEKASREVEKMVECMEEAAARFNAAALDELMGGDGNEEFK